MSPYSELVTLAMIHKIVRIFQQKSQLPRQVRFSHHPCCNYYRLL